MTTIEIDLASVQKITRDIKKTARLITDDEARTLVDLYYSIQDFRIRAGNQISAIARGVDTAPTETLSFFHSQFDVLEGSVKSALDAYSLSSTPGRWARSVIGIGPVLAAALLAHIDIEKAPTAGHIWRFAGLDPTVTWNKGQKRPFNASLKVVCWKIGESFVKVQSNRKDVYGKVYLERKAFETDRNERLMYSDQAAAILEKKKIGKDTEAYKAYIIGKLPPAQIHARAKRYAVKLFLSAYQHVAFECRFGEPPPKPYVITHLGHAHYLAPPNWPMDNSLAALAVA